MATVEFLQSLKDSFIKKIIPDIELAIKEFTNYQNQAQVAHDIHKKLGIEWGENVYAKINSMQTQLRNLMDGESEVLAARAEVSTLNRRIVELERENVQEELTGWMIEVKHGTNPRTCWTGGRHWHWDMNRGILFDTKAEAEETAQAIFGEFLWLCAGTKIEICEHTLRRPLLRPAIRIDPSKIDKEALIRGAKVAATLKEPKTRGED